MADTYINRFPVTITTGIVTPSSTAPGKAAQPQQSGEPFAEVLRKQQQAFQVNFSKHAQTRIADRNIDISGEKMERLTQGMRLAGEKGLDDTLILIDKTAFIVSVKNGTVVTTVNGDDLNGNVFTNIDGTVIV